MGRAKTRSRDLFGTAALFVLAIPVSAFVTLLLLPLWRWIEESTHVESVGHSGPASWCFIVSYLVVAAAGTWTWSHRRRRD
jgi:hypothetical protein